MNKIKSGVFVLVEVTGPSSHVEYNWWHSSDHIPENLAIQGIALGTRWAAPGRYKDARQVVHPAFAAHQYLVHYLMTEPLEETWREFIDLGARARALGRSFERRKVLYAGHFRFIKGYVSPRIEVSPEALPFRPSRGVLVVMADATDAEREPELAKWYDQVQIPDMLTVKGVMGAYWFRSRGTPHAGDGTVGDPVNRHVFLYYLDEDPLSVMAELKSQTAEWRRTGRMLDTTRSMRTILAGPYMNIDNPRRFDLNETLTP